MIAAVYDVVCYSYAEDYRENLRQTFVHIVRMTPALYKG
jgi:hypothetical protein